MRISYHTRRWTTAEKNSRWDETSLLVRLWIFHTIRLSICVLSQFSSCMQAHWRWDWGMKNYMWCERREKTDRQAEDRFCHTHVKIAGFSSFHLVISWLSHRCDEHEPLPNIVLCELCKSVQNFFRLSTVKIKRDERGLRKGETIWLSLCSHGRITQSTRTAERDRMWKWKNLRFRMFIFARFQNRHTHTQLESERVAVIHSHVAAAESHTKK